MNGIEISVSVCWSSSAYVNAPWLERSFTSLNSDEYKLK